MIQLLQASGERLHRPPQPCEDAEGITSARQKQGVLERKVRISSYTRDSIPRLAAARSVWA